jgi:hypothetical protein
MSLAFNLNNYVYIPHNAGFDTLTGPLTIACWVNFSALAGMGMFINRMVSATPGNEWWALDAYGNSLRGLIGSAASVSTASATTAPALAINTWYHMVMTYDGTTMLIYQDALQVGSAARTQTFTTDTTGVVVGANAQAAGDTGITEFLQGSLEDLRLYNRALAQNEITTIRNCEGRDSIYNGLLFRFALDEQPSGTIASGTNSIKDSGLLGMHGTPYGSCVYGPSVHGLRRMTNTM